MLWVLSSFVELFCFVCVFFCLFFNQSASNDSTCICSCQWQGGNINAVLLSWSINTWRDAVKGSNRAHCAACGLSRLSRSELLERETFVVGMFLAPGAPQAKCRQSHYFQEKVSISHRFKKKKKVKFKPKQLRWMTGTLNGANHVSLWAPRHWDLSFHSFHRVNSVRQNSKWKRYVLQLTFLS